MTRTGEICRLYSEIVERQPSRFYDRIAYLVWRENALAWGEVNVDRWGSLIPASRIGLPGKTDERMKEK